MSIYWAGQFSFWSSESKTFFTVFSYFTFVLFKLNKLYLLYIFCSNNSTEFKILINYTKFSCAPHLSQYEKLQNKGIYNILHNYNNTLLYMMNVVKYLISNVVLIMFLQQLVVEAMGNNQSSPPPHLPLHLLQKVSNSTFF